VVALAIEGRFATRSGPSATAALGTSNQFTPARALAHPLVSAGTFAGRYIFLRQRLKPGVLADQIPEGIGPEHDRQITGAASGHRQPAGRQRHGLVRAAGLGVLSCCMQDDSRILELIAGFIGSGQRRLDRSDTRVGVAQSGRTVGQFKATLTWPDRRCRSCR